MKFLPTSLCKPTECFKVGYNKELQTHEDYSRASFFATFQGLGAFLVYAQFMTSDSGIAAIHVCVQAVAASILSTTTKYS